MEGAKGKPEVGARCFGGSTCNFSKEGEECIQPGLEWGDREPSGGKEPSWAWATWTAWMGLPGPVGGGGGAGHGGEAEGDGE